MFNPDQAVHQSRLIHYSSVAHCKLYHCCAAQLISDSGQVSENAHLIGKVRKEINVKYKVRLIQCLTQLLIQIPTSEHLFKRKVNHIRLTNKVN